MSEWPELTFPIVKLGGTETPWDLKPLLYRGGAAIRVNRVAGVIAQGALGMPIPERLSLVSRMREELLGILVGGGSKETVRNIIDSCRFFFSWADDTEQNLSLETARDVYLLWADYLLHRYRQVKPVTEHTIYDHAMRVASVLDLLLERRSSILFETRIRRPRRGHQGHISPAHKQNLEQTFIFGHALLDICDALTEQAIWGGLPVVISFQTGVSLEEWSGLPKKPCDEAMPRSRWHAEQSRLARKAWIEEKTIRTRFPLINLRIEAELLIFIAQTGMNLAQAHTMKIDQFHYSGHLDGYQVRRYKARRQGEVEFEIYSAYRTIFERYLNWRTAIFPGNTNDLLFPLVRRGKRAEEDAPSFTRIRKICQKLSMRFLAPQNLRKTRVNWLLRRSRDSSQTAEIAQHVQATLLQSYSVPDPQVAMVEISRFHMQLDPVIVPPGPGLCVAAVPEAISDTPIGATPPDCISGAGCLFCIHQRDIDSQDHVWSLASFRYLKSLEVARHRALFEGDAYSPPQPAVLAVNQLTTKLEFFHTSSAIRAQWVREAEARVEEGNYHPAWCGFIQLAELKT